MASFSIHVLSITQKAFGKRVSQILFCWQFQPKKEMIEDYDKETSHLNSQPYNIFRVDIFFLGETKLFIYLVSFNFNTQYIWCFIKVLCFKIWMAIVWLQQASQYQLLSEEYIHIWCRNIKNSRNFLHITQDSFNPYNFLTCISNSHLEYNPWPLIWVYNIK